MFIPNRPDFSLPEFTYSFWVYLITFNKDGKDDLNCPIILKGNDDFKLKTFLRYPGIYINEKSRKIKVYISLNDKKNYKQVLFFLYREFGQKVQGDYLYKDGLRSQLLFQAPK